MALVENVKVGSDYVEYKRFSNRTVESKFGDTINLNDFGAVPGDAVACTKGLSMLPC